MIVIQNADIWTPEHLGLGTVLVEGATIIDIWGPGLEPDLLALENALGRENFEVVDARGQRLVPGIVDPHLHVTGGGGEGGFGSRAAEVTLELLVKHGITTVVGLLGTDGITRSLENLYAKVKSLDEGGISAWMYTGSYRFPTPTLTGSVDRDLVLIDRVLGVGEIAIADHRGSQVTMEELARVASQARQGGLLSGKAGLVHLHLGDHSDGLGVLYRTLDWSAIPASQFYPTHINRNGRLPQASLDFIARGGNIDLTAGYEDDGDVTSIATALEYLWSQGANPANISASSDAHGSMPIFGPGGELVGIETAPAGILLADVRTAVLEKGLPFDKVWQTISTNPARILGWGGQVGRIKPGYRADLVLVNKDLEVTRVWAKGKSLL